MNKLHIVDTNILCCYLQIPGKETVGSSKEWTLEKIEQKIEQIHKNAEGIVIPLPMMIELGNHIGHGQYRSSYSRLKELIKKTIDFKAPFHAFNEQQVFWQGNGLLNIVERWEEHFYTSNAGLGDILVLALASYFKTNLSGRRYEVEIWSADNGLNLLDGIDFFSEKVEPVNKEEKIRKARY
ncbi:MAG: hypothetical protein ACRCZI_04895 [Cetobacterium sp.]